MTDYVIYICVTEQFVLYCQLIYYNFSTT